MGTTSKGLRYPEGSVLANTLHTRIKELADDTNAALVSRDARLDGLDTKTNATNTVIDSRGLPITRSSSYASALTNLPNNNAWYTCHQTTGIVYIPSNARTMHVSMQLAAHCVTNAQCHWRPLVSLNNGSASWLDLAPGYLTTHNQGQVAINLGFAASGIFDVRGYGGQLVALAINAYNDAGSGAWIHVGYHHWTVTTLA